MNNFYWDDPYLLKYCPDQIFQRYIPDNEASDVIKSCHSEAHWGHFLYKKNQLQKSYNVNFIGSPCSRIMISL
jgi:hypothetical protein